MNIGFFGDSFCADYKNQHSINNVYQTYIEQVATHYNANITNLGIGGSSVWDLMLIQFKEQEKLGLPDVCVFCWTDPDRVFHREYRKITVRITDDSHPLKLQNPQLHESVKHYYYQLYDEEKHRYEYVAALHYFDNMLKQYPDTKFIHLWSMANDDHGEAEYYYNWKTGVEIRPALELMSRATPANKLIPMNDDRPNHINGNIKNNLIYNWIINAIDNYDHGLLLNYSDQPT